MRNKFDQQLALLNEELTAMGALCEKAIAGAAKALVEADIGLAKSVIEMDAQIDRKERDIEGLCLRLLLQQQPVARDLRTISSALKMITDMERIGDQAADICEITLVADLKTAQSKIHIGDMARATIKMVSESVEAFVHRDLSLAYAVISYDDEVDELFNKVK